MLIKENFLDEFYCSISHLGRLYCTDHLEDIFPSVWGEGNFTNLLIYQALRAVSARVVDPNTGTLNLDPDPEFWLSLDPDPVLCYQF